MIKKRFEALGTVWGLLIDSPDFSDEHFLEIKNRASQFENEFSRFIQSSQANAFINKPAGKYQVSSVMEELLTAAQNLKGLTEGGFDPVVSSLLSEVGYGKQFLKSSHYSEIEKNDSLKSFPKWSIKGNILTTDGPIQFDFGGIGKGYFIDKVSEFLLEKGYSYHLVEGGGDMVATTKSDGQGWRIALEYPGRKDEAIGTLMLQNQAFAGSDSFKRKWGAWHHLINARTRRPVEEIKACMVTAPSAFKADQFTSAIFFSLTKDYQKAKEEFLGSYFILFSEGTYCISDNWTGKFFR